MIFRRSIRSGWFHRPGQAPATPESTVRWSRNVSSKAITDHLLAHGFEVVDANADASMTWQIATRSGLEGNDSGISVGFGTFGRHSAVGIGYGFPGYDVDSYDESVLTVDVQKAADDTLLWRGSSSRRLVDGATPESITKTVHELVSEVLANFPPR